MMRAEEGLAAAAAKAATNSCNCWGLGLAIIIPQPDETDDLDDWGDDWGDEEYQNQGEDVVDHGTITKGDDKPKPVSKPCQEKDKGVDVNIDTPDFVSSTSTSTSIPNAQDLASPSASSSSSKTSIPIQIPSAVSALASAKRVQFNPSPEIYHFEDDEASREGRQKYWEFFFTDGCRFRERIAEVNDRIGHIFDPAHVKRIYEERILPHLDAAPAPKEK